MPASPASTAARHHTSRSSGAAPSLRVLLCAAERSPSARVLSRPGRAITFQVVAAPGPEALQAALAERWDAVVVDASCPRLRVDRVPELITARGLSLPMVAVCAGESEAEGIARLEDGFSDYLLPDRLERLPYAVRAAVERSELARRAAHAENADLGRRRSEADLARSLEELHRIERERRRLLRLLVQAHEDERRSIAADIHDDPLQVMAAVALRLHVLRRRLDDQPAVRTLESVEDMVGSAMSRLRTLMFNLRPPALEQGELVGPLRVRLEQVRRDEMIDYSVTGDEPTALTTEARVTLYRIAQEAIVNVVKHASASHIAVAVEQRDGGCQMRIADDGFGLGSAPADRPGHFGLLAMREWAELAGGWLQVEDGQEAGTLVTAWVPAPGMPVAASGDAP